MYCDNVYFGTLKNLEKSLLFYSAYFRIPLQIWLLFVCDYSDINHSTSEYSHFLKMWIGKILTITAKPTVNRVVTAVLLGWCVCYASQYTYKTFHCVISLYQIIIQTIQEMPLGQNYSKPEPPTINAISMCLVWNYGINYHLKLKTAVLSLLSREASTNMWARLPF